MGEIQKSFGGLWFGVALLGIGMVGCATQPAALPIPRPQVVLLAPTSIDQRVAEPLRPGAAAIQQVIGELLGEQDVVVSAPPPPAFYALWQDALLTSASTQDGVVAAAGDDAAVRALLEGLRARGERFDVLLVPYLTVRVGSGNTQWIRWDGVARKLPFEHGRNVGSEVSFTGRRTIKAPCTSLGVIAYGPHGERLFERIGGLEVANRMRISADGRTRSWSERQDLFQDERALRSGVEVALGPLLEN